MFFVLQMFAGAAIAGWLCTILAVSFTPKPKAPKPVPALLRPKFVEPEPPFDPSAFWLYPDWNGPLDEPFWMRPPNAPATIEDKTFVRVLSEPMDLEKYGQPIPLAWGAVRVAPQRTAERLAVEDHVRRLRKLASGDNRFRSMILEPEQMSPEQVRRRTLRMMRARRLG